MMHRSEGQDKKGKLPGLSNGTNDKGRTVENVFIEPHVSVAFQEAQLLWDSIFSTDGAWKSRVIHCSYGKHYETAFPLFVTDHWRRLAMKFGTAIHVFALGVFLPCAAMTAKTAIAGDTARGAAAGAAVGAVTGEGAVKGAAAGAVLGGTSSDGPSAAKGAARGAAVGAVTGVDAGKAAATGAVVGAARKDDSD
jgi:hypothetical protein